MAAGEDGTRNSSWGFPAQPPYLDLHKIDGLHEPGLGSQHTGIQAAPSRGDDLATPTVDSISVQRHIMDIKAHAPHVLLAQRPLRRKEDHHLKNPPPQQLRDRLATAVCFQDHAQSHLTR